MRGQNASFPLSPSSSLWVSSLRDSAVYSQGSFSLLVNPIVQGPQRCSQRLALLISGEPLSTTKSAIKMKHHRHATFHLWIWLPWLELAKWDSAAWSTTQCSWVKHTARFICAMAYMFELFFYPKERAYMYIHHDFLTHSCIEDHLACYFLWTAVTNVPLSTDAQRSIWVFVSNSFGYRHKSHVMGSPRSSVYSFWKARILFFI